MSGEGKNKDFKIAYDPVDRSAKLGLVKDLVAMANSGGGTILIGRSETQFPGIDPILTDHLDSAKIADYAGKFIAPSSLDVSHDIEQLDNGNVIFSLRVSSAAYPIVMNRQGTWTGFDSSKDKPLFRKGEIWARHSSKTEKVSHEDLRIWIEVAKQAERDKIMERLTTYVNLPEGTTLQAVSPSGFAIDSPMRLIESARYRRARDPDHLLSSDDLLWIFRQRGSLDLIREDLQVVIASSLRRSATLYWWLIKAEREKGLIVRELRDVFGASDRDKSDAASSIVELAALFATDEELQALRKNLAESKYKHFQDAAADWSGRAAVLGDLADRISRATHDNKPLLDYSASDLERIASLSAGKLAENRSPGLSRKLSTIVRVIWAKESERGKDLLDRSGA